MFIDEENYAAGYDQSIQMQKYIPALLKLMIINFQDEQTSIATNKRWNFIFTQESMCYGYSLEES